MTANNLNKIVSPINSTSNNSQMELKFKHQMSGQARGWKRSREILIPMDVARIRQIYWKINRKKIILLIQSIMLI